MGGKVKNQHYVPRMYLKRFTSDNNRFSVWKKDDDEILSRQRPENFAARRYYYDTNEEELKNALREQINIVSNIESLVDYNDEQFVEKALSRIEAAAEKTINAISIDNEALYDEDNMRTIILFFHDLAYRTEKYRDMMESIRGQTFAHLERLGVDINKYIGTSKSAKDTQLYQLLAITPSLETMTKLVENYNWYIGIVSDKMKLIVSDNPAQGIWMGFNDICIPISGEKAIIFRIRDSSAPILSKDMPKENVIMLSERSVFVYNLLQSSYSNRFIFGDKYSLEFLRKIEHLYKKHSNIIKAYGELKRKQSKNRTSIF